MIKLVPNWSLQLFKYITVIGLFLLIPIFSTVTFRVAIIVLIPTLLTFFIISKMNLQLLHCYKPGICYKRIFGERYISREEIKSISFKSFFINTIFKVSLLNGRSIYFYNWRLDEKTRTAIYKSYSDKVIG